MQQALFSRVTLLPHTGELGHADIWIVIEIACEDASACAGSAREAARLKVRGGFSRVPRKIYNPTLSVC